ncbi:hypothetical protein NDU88_005926 [Pleurodeles waltl]|uniref:Uncharacterized protein n=1 Tax=Pleurodeles waltl TaxID=8319 RepID=A0AAV7PGU3_PLEWA|nr:hypothetical protein NDU88_005926 [Pleurodeles waltl]
MEEVDVGDHHDDLERMLAQMRAEALKRGKDWLRGKMEESGPEGVVPQLSDQNAPSREDAGDPGSEVDHTHKPSKRQRSVGKPAKKVVKKPKGPDRSTAPPPDLEAPESGSTHTPTEGEHLSAIIKECLKSITPLLLKGGGTGPNLDCAGKGRSQENLSKGQGPGLHTEGNERAHSGDPTPACGVASKEIEPLEWLDLTVCDKKDEDRCERKRTGKERNFENWLDAFRIMACVKVEKFP